ncbi:MAG: OB-fold domain-containing protein [Actinomycetes bacterium]
MTEPLIARHSLEYPGGYTRSVGPIIGRYLTGLREGRIEGVRLADGRVLVPPTEYDPQTAAPTSVEDFVEVGPLGTVESWSWVAAPRPDKHRLDRPFAFALIRPDGADTAMLHMVAVDRPEAMSVGMRVAPHWRAERVGGVADIEAWRPHADGDPIPEVPAIPGSETMEEGEVTGIVSTGRLDFEISAGAATSRFLLGLAEGRIIGGRAPDREEVYAASRGTDPMTGEPTSVEVEVRDSGIVTTFCVVNIPGLSDLAPEIPYVSAQVLLDGANNTFFGLIRGCEVDEVRMGMRVKAKWRDELAPDHRSIEWWEPTGEPDAPLDDYKDYL